MDQLKAYVTFEVPNEVFRDGNYEATEELIRLRLKELAAELGGRVYDIEMK